MERIVMHIDVNNAFLSWTAVSLLESGYDVDIRTIPSIIGGDESRRAGIVLAKSPIAKKYGIVTAETIYSAKRKCPDLKVFPPDYLMYRRRSEELFSFLRSFSPDIEIASIDECYLEYTNVHCLYGDPISFAYSLKDKIKSKFGFTVNIGIANNKFCAKMASDFTKPDKVHTLFSDEVALKMFPLPISDLFMVGKSTSSKLMDLGINTIGDLAKSDPYDLKRVFKNNATHLVDMANGRDDSLVICYDNEVKGISNEVTLSSDLTSKSDIYKVLSPLASKVAGRIRKEGKYAGVICVILKDNTFKRYSHQKKVLNPVNSYSDIYKTCCLLLDEFYHNEPIRLVGIRLDDLKESRVYQTSLFDSDSSSNSDSLDKLMDSINSKYGKEVVKRAVFVEK